jgi:hypothetical protein
VVLGHVFFQVFWFYPVSGIFPVLCVRSFIDITPMTVILAAENVIKKKKKKKKAKEENA